MTNEVMNPFQQFLDATGLPLAAGTISFFTNKTTDLDSIFSDEALTVAQTNPYTLDAAGRVQGDVKYKGKLTLLIKNAEGGTIRTIDDVTTIGPGLLTENIFYAENYDTFALALTAASGGELIISTVIAVSVNATVTDVTLTQSGAGRINPDTGITVTINVPVKCGDAQKFFGGAGTVTGTFGDQPLKVLWWGGNTSDDHQDVSDALDSMILGGLDIDFGVPENVYKILQDSSVPIDNTTIFTYTAMADFISKSGIKIRSGGATLSVGRDYPLDNKRDIIFRFASCENADVGTFKCVYTGTRFSEPQTGAVLVFLKDSNKNIRVNDQVINDWSLGVWVEATKLSVAVENLAIGKIHTNTTGYPVWTHNAKSVTIEGVNSIKATRSLTLDSCVGYRANVKSTNHSGSNNVGLTNTLVDVEINYVDDGESNNMIQDDHITISYPSEFDNDFTIFTGTHDAGTSATVLSDVGAFPAGPGLVTRTLKNKTAGCHGIVIANDGDTATVSALFEGTRQDWQNGDSYELATSHICRNLKIRSTVKALTGEARGYAMKVGVGVGSVQEDRDPGYILNGLDLEVNLFTDDNANQLSFQVEDPTPWKPGFNLRDLRIKLNLEGAVLPAIDLAPLLDTAVFDNPICDTQLQIINCNTGAYVINGGKFKTSSLNSTDTSRGVLIGSTITVGADQSVTNKEFIGCIINGDRINKSSQGGALAFSGVSSIVVTNANVTVDTFPGQIAPTDNASAQISVADTLVKKTASVGVSITIGSASGNSITGTYRFVLEEMRA